MQIVERLASDKVRATDASLGLREYVRREYGHGASVLQVLGAVLRGAHGRRAKPGRHSRAARTSQLRAESASGGSRSRSLARLVEQD